MVRTLLLFPPEFTPVQPFLSLPTLKAYLESRGRHVDIRDFNIESLLRLGSPKWLRRAAGTIERAFARLDSRPRLTLLEQRQYDRLARVYPVIPYVLDNIEAAQRVFRNPETFYDPERHMWAFNVIGKAFELVSAAHYPTEYGLYTIEMRYSSHSSRQVWEAAHDSDENPWHDLFFEELVPQAVAETRPGLVGIGVSTPQQIIGGMTLAKVVKQLYPDLPVVIGGSPFTRLIGQIRANEDAARRLFDLTDYFIVAEGEEALDSLIEHIEGRRTVEDVPNLLYRQGGDVRLNEPLVATDLDALPPPNFDGYPLDSYFSPVRAMPVLAGKGCYWLKCSFCIIPWGSHFVHSDSRVRSVKATIDDVEHLQSRYGCRHFTFVSECLSPVYLTELANEINHRGLKLEWTAWCRFEPEFTAERLAHLVGAGLRKISFGYEFGTQRVLDLSDKGTQLATVRQVLRDCTDTGMAVHLFAFVGFPTQTVDEATETLEFVFREVPEITRTYSFSMNFEAFDMHLHSRTLKEYDRFQVDEAVYLSDHDIALIFPYRSAASMGMMAAAELAPRLAEQVLKRLPDRGFSGTGGIGHDILFLSKFRNLQPPPIARPVKQEVSVEPDSRLTLRTGSQFIRFSYPLRAVQDNLRACEREILEQTLYGQDVLAAIHELAPGRDILPTDTHVVCWDSHSLIVTGQALQLLKMVDGRLTVRDIAQRINSTPEHQTAVLDQCLRFFEAMAAAGVLVTEQTVRA